MESDFFRDPTLQQQATAAGYASVETYIQILVQRDRERLAIAEGVEAMRSGRVRPFEEFDREFREQQGLEPRC